MITKKHFIMLLMLCLTTVSSAQNTAEEIVKQYIDLLNEWLGSPDNTTKHNNVLNMFQTDGRGSGIKDAIVEKYNKDSGRSNCFPRMYLCLFYDEGTQQRINVEIIGTLTDNSDKYGTIITAVLRYSGGISLTTVSDFWISGNKISGIVSNEREITELNIDKVIYDNPPIQHEEPEKDIVVKDTTITSNHEYVDLGLPSGTLWATCNVGADNPWEYGDYFAWGETKAKTEYLQDNYKYAYGSWNELTKYRNNGVFRTDKIILEYIDDAATTNWGRDWRMPTKEEFQELIDNCNSEMTDFGCVFTSKKNGKEILFPAVGYKENAKLFLESSDGMYWTSSLSSSEEAWHLFVNYTPQLDKHIRSYGYAVRAVLVRKKATTSVSNKKEKQTNIGKNNSMKISDKQDSLSKTFTIDGVSFKMVYVKFDLKTLSIPVDESSETIPFYELDDYYIGETEVTQGLWKAVMGTNPSVFPQGDNYPVEKVSWYDCQEFIKKLNRLTNQNFRLPTENEWQYAAFGGNKSEISKYKYSGSDDIKKVAWFGRNSHNKTHPVKKKNPNEIGLYDMTGNVLEWCQDWYDWYIPSPQCTEIVLRGGAWCYEMRQCKILYRIGFKPNNHNGWTGLRLALSLE